MAAVECRCDRTRELYGDEAERYVAEHLRSTGSRTEVLEEDYTCPDTGMRWLLDFPERTERESGQARLRAELV